MITHHLDHSSTDLSGQDVYGVWKTVSVFGVEINLRRVPAGSFSMGSIEEELGRTLDEGPQHRVSISQDTWMFETPVTQAVWVAAMGRNPSRFRSPSRPVERVSYHNVMLFMARVNESQQAFKLSLPTEAQWEYACRAGTAAATWCGEHQLEGINYAHVLDDISWYAGNSSYAFKSAQGVDSSSWVQCEYQGEHAGTHQVGLKEPNPWGLYDMLGNVWEWCDDSMRTYSESAELLVDPVGDEYDDVRCARGGSWRDSPRKLRASYRDQIELDYKNDFVGFRCLASFE